MAKKKTAVQAGRQLKKLHFLIGKWHTTGKILQGAPGSSNEIRGMDTYEWISGGFLSFIVWTFLWGMKEPSPLKSLVMMRAENPISCTPLTIRVIQLLCMPSWKNRAF